MRFSELASHLHAILPKQDVVISNLSLHSSHILPNCAFVALQGNTFDGNAFISQAIANGCKAIITSKANIQVQSVPILVIDSLESRLWEIIKFIYPKYSWMQNVYGVTGTNGKTTISYLIRYLLEKSGKACSLIGTIEYWDGAQKEVASHTTPPSTDICRILHRSSLHGIQNCVMEISSHSLQQERLGDITLQGGIFTNLTRDHLDYHHTMEEYKLAKIKMLTLIKKQGVVIVNDNEFGDELKKIANHRVWMVGKRNDCDYCIQNIQMNIKGTSFQIKWNQNLYPIFTPLIGEHNIYNCVQAIALLHQQGFNLEDLIEKISVFSGVSGRLEAVRLPSVKTPSVFVDYAHTPDAMDNVLKSIASLKGNGKIWVLFGCGGDRDRAKRPLMAQSAEKFGDFVVVTSDNPRTEQPDKIMEEICIGFSKGFAFKRLVDRREAIKYVIQSAKPEDLVLLLGKGHEDYQIIGTVKNPFDDREEAKKSLEFWKDKI